MSLEPYVAQLFAGFLVFCRVGAALMLLPGFGDAYVPVRIRLALALSLTLILTPLVSPSLPADMSSDGVGLGLIATELGVGLFFGMISRITLSALNTAGSIIALQTGLSSAMDYDVTAGQQGVTLGAFLGALGLVLVFATDVHHLLLKGLVESYRMFEPGKLPPLGDFSETITRLVSRSFAIALALSAPFLLVGTVVSVGMGLLARLMPSIQVFFVLQPVQIALGLAAFGLTLSAGMEWFLDQYQTAVTQTLGVG
jgi:flagellar biosynthetic protein FliR